MNSENEHYELLDAMGQPTGQSKARALVHRDGDWHGTVHIWIINEKKEILFQKRAAQKDSNPNLWDVSSAGHIDFGETPLQAAIRETREELGIELQDEQLIFLQTIQSINPSDKADYIDREFQHIYVVQGIHFDLDDFTIKLDELSEIQYFPSSWLVHHIAQKSDHLVTHPEEFQILLHYLEKI